MKEAKILIVDDSSFYRTYIRDILEKAGFKVVGEAGSVKEAVQKSIDLEPNLVTMDMAILGGDGFQCSQEIHRINSHIRIIMISSMMDDEMVKKAKMSNISSFIQKPVDPEQLVAKVKQLVVGEELLEELEDVYVDAFKEALISNIQRIFKATPESTETEKTAFNHASRGISTVIGIIGKYSGRMIMDVSKETGDKIASAMLRRDPKDKKESMVVIAEFANIISGNACSMLNQKNKMYGLRVAPPAMFHGESLNISQSKLETNNIIVSGDFGEIYINIGFKRGEDEWI